MLIQKNLRLNPERTSGKSVRHFLQLLKLRLTAFVVISGGIGFLAGSKGETDWFALFALMLGSFLITGASGAVNQILEKDYDKLMKRTASRPLPTGVLNVRESAIFAFILTILGTLILLSTVGTKAAVLTLISMLLYAFVYTPLKRVSPFAVFIGAFPGAFPPFIGYVAAADAFSLEAGLLFLIQFLWQFPHFWAIAWLGDEDYKKAGFRLIPNGEKNRNTAVQIVAYTAFLLPASLAPWYLGYSGGISAFVGIFSGILFVFLAYRLLQTMSNKAALRLMFGSFFYLPAVLLAILLDKI
jgi:protoheme IX farnesyltransferase